MPYFFDPFEVERKELVPGLTPEDDVGRQGDDEPGGDSARRGVAGTPSSARAGRYRSPGRARLHDRGRDEAGEAGGSLCDTGRRCSQLGGIGRMVPRAGHLQPAERRVQKLRAPVRALSGSASTARMRAHVPNQISATGWRPASTCRLAAAPMDIFRTITMRRAP